MRRVVLIALCLTTAACDGPWWNGGQPAAFSQAAIALDQHFKAGKLTVTGRTYNVFEGDPVVCGYVRGEGVRMAAFVWRAGDLSITDVDDPAGFAFTPKARQECGGDWVAPMPGRLVRRPVSS